jgi:hypothetical protein
MAMCKTKGPGISETARNRAIGVFLPIPIRPSMGDRKGRFTEQECFTKIKRVSGSVPEKENPSKLNIGRLS